MNRILAVALPLGAAVAVLVAEEGTSRRAYSGSGSDGLARSVSAAPARGVVAYQIAQAPPAQETPPATPEAPPATPPPTATPPPPATPPPATPSPPTPPGAQAPPAPPGSPGPAPAEVAPAPPQELAAKDIEAERVRARVIYARRVEARGGKVAAIVEDRETKLWLGGPPTEGSVTAREIDVGVIYAERVKAAWIEADRVYAQEVEIGK